MSVTTVTNLINGLNDEPLIFEVKAWIFFVFKI
jgi:hypothetical protein